jgi:hypothetical protein
VKKHLQENDKQVAVNILKQQRPPMDSLGSSEVHPGDPVAKAANAWPVNSKLETQNSRKKYR